jgi:hypothetical protein
MEWMALGLLCQGMLPSQEGKELQEEQSIQEDSLYSSTMHQGVWGKLS